MTIKFQFYRGKECPADLLKLTLTTGLMQYWIKGEKNLLRAMVAYDGDEMVGWCGYCFEKRNVVKMGTFVAPSHRGKGLSRQLVRRALGMIAESNGQCEVKYGGPLFRHFNDLYYEEIRRAGLTPVNWYG